MNKSNKTMPTGNAQDNSRLEHIMYELNEEAANLPDDIANRLAVARQKALQANQQSHVLATRQTPSRTTLTAASQHSQRVLQSLSNLWEVRPMALASVSIAILAAVLFINTPDTVFVEDSTITLAETAANVMLPETELTGETVATLQPANFEDPALIAPTAITSGSDSLELYESIDFLLWLEAQQG